MGCGGSKLDDFQAVLLCRERTQCLADAIQLRYALADAHQAYILSLRGVGENLHHLFNGSELLSPPSPILPLPPQRKGDAMPPLSPPLSPPRLHSRSNSGSHLHFNPSESDYEDEGALHSTNSSPLHKPSEEYVTTSINFATKEPSPAKSYEQKPLSPEQVQISEPSFYRYPHESYYSDSFFDAYPPATAKAATFSPETRPPAPPSPPPASPWDFLNPFEYTSYVPSKTSKELREEEGIPDLEDDEVEIVKEAHDRKSVASSSSTFEEELQSKASTSFQPEEIEEKKSIENPPNDNHPTITDIVMDEVRTQEEIEIPHQKLVPVRDVKQLFDRVSESCDEISKMLEVGKSPYYQKKYEVVSSRMRNAVVLPLSLSYPPKGDLLSLDLEEDMAMKSGNLSSTLRKLFMWEKKLLEEVRTEEKLRVLYEQKRRRLTRLEERNADGRKVGPTEVNVRKLSTKIRVAIQVVDSIASRISQLRDEELWPQLLELIHGMVVMWKSMMECLRSQYSAIIESANIEGISSEVRAEVLKQLELSLLKWIDSFCSWFHAQKSFVKALNSWLMKCLLYEPEVTPDGIVPFSPGRLGAPPVFVICNQWSQAMDNISDGEVVAAMQSFATSVLQLWDKERLADRQRMMVNRDMDRRLRIQEKEEMVVHRAVDTLNKKLVMASESSRDLSYGQMVVSNNTEAGGSMRDELKRIFDSMERLAESSVQVYEDLCERNGEEIRHGVP